MVSGMPSSIYGISWRSWRLGVLGVLAVQLPLFGSWQVLPLDEEISPRD